MSGSSCAQSTCLLFEARLRGRWSESEEGKGDASCPLILMTLEWDPESWRTLAMKKGCNSCLSHSLTLPLYRLASTKKAVLTVTGKSALLESESDNVQQVPTLNEPLGACPLERDSTACFNEPGHVNSVSDLSVRPSDDDAPFLVQASMLELKIALRAPYVAPLNILQCLCLRALREVEEKGSDAVGSYNPSDPEIIDLLSRDPNKGNKQPFVAAMYDALLITIKGVAAGMQNTG